MFKVDELRIWEIGMVQSNLNWADQIFDDYYHGLRKRLGVIQAEQMRDGSFDSSQAIFPMIEAFVQQANGVLNGLQSVVIGDAPKPWSALEDQQVQAEFSEAFTRLCEEAPALIMGYVSPQIHGTEQEIKENLTLEISMLHKRLARLSRRASRRYALVAGLQVIKDFVRGDVIVLPSGDTSVLYTVAGQSGADLEMVHNDDGQVSQIVLQGVVKQDAGFVHDRRTAEEAVGFNFVEDRQEGPFLEPTFVDDTATGYGVAESEPAYSSSAADASAWTGNPTRAQRLVALRGPISWAQDAVEYLIRDLEMNGGNGGPPLDERNDAVEALRELHAALGSVLRAIDGNRFDDLGEGLLASIARAGARCVENARQEPGRLMIALGIGAVCDSLNMGTVGGVLTAVALTASSARSERKQ